MLEIVGAGFGRTGTKSLKEALAHLGYGPCHHMHELVKNPEQLATWRYIANGQLPDWYKVFSGYRAQVDWPGAFFWQELCEAFPNAKVILTVRDPETWYDSMCRTIVKTIPHPDGTTDPVLRDMRTVARDIVYKNLFHQNFESRHWMISKYLEHIEAVQASVDHDRLLTYSVRDGWEPLCEFLGVSIPNIPFPSENSEQHFWSFQKR